MVLSRAVLNMADPVARKDLANPYEMHSTLMRLVDAGSSRPLWRLEQTRDPNAPPIVLIQTKQAPDGEVLRGASATYLLEFGSRENRLLDQTRVGDVLNFRLRANPTVTRDRKRHGLERTEDQLAWLKRQTDRAGATLIDAQTSHVGKLQIARRSSERRIVIMGVTFDGQLEVTDPEALRTAVMTGIGPGKALGFGLLTLAR